MRGKPRQPLSSTQPPGCRSTSISGLGTRPSAATSIRRFCRFISTSAGCSIRRSRAARSCLAGGKISRLGACRPVGPSATGHRQRPTRLTLPPTSASRATSPCYRSQLTRRQASRASHRLTKLSTLDLVVRPAEVQARTVKWRRQVVVVLPPMAREKWRRQAMVLPSTAREVPLRPVELRAGSSERSP